MKENTTSYSKVKKILCKVFSILVFIIVWQLLVDFNIKRPLMFGNLPSPLDVFQALKTIIIQKEFYQHALYSCIRIFIGCTLALPIAVIFGFLIGLTKFGENFILPIFDMLRPIPQIAWIPIAILIFPSVEGSIIFITFLGAFFPILVNTIAGTQAANSLLIEAAKSMSASKWQLIRYVSFPSAVPNIFTGLTIGIGSSWMSVIAAEMISGKYGIGYYTWTSYTLMEYPETIIGMITIGVIGATCFSLVRKLEKIILVWRE
ncbi:ABC transporter permease [Clostridium kluyveri]|uniref:ABC transporter permease n=1 Tax=Clostridium kluyveri TaxID=1534 RepID=A0A1L5FB86_CLOKL|nr:ABC transporter permease [Clostridium kluyveri]APM40276.1 ABC transporter permease [Clostridium kluyveri]